MKVLTAEPLYNDNTDAIKYINNFTLMHSSYLPNEICALS
jgi:hypothetical protein